MISINQQLQALDDKLQLGSGDKLQAVSIYVRTKTLSAMKKTKVAFKFFFSLIRSHGRGHPPCTFSISNTRPQNDK